MSIYIFLVFTIFICGALQKRGLISLYKNCLIIGILFALITGLRSSNVGSDTAGYYIAYDEFAIVETPLSQILEDHSDIAYYTVTWVLARIGVPFWLFLLMVSSFFYYSVTRFIYKYSKDITLSFLSLMALNFFQFSMTGIRQTIALGFVLMAFYEIFKPKEISILYFIILVLIGYLFHNSCIICLILLPFIFYRKSLGNFAIMLSILALLFAYIYKYQLIFLLFYLIGETRFEEYGELINTNAGLSTYIFYGILYVMLLYNKTNYVEQNKRGTLDIWLLFFALLFQGLVMVQPIMFRMAWYFAISLIITIPNLIETFPKDNRKMARIGFYSFIVLMYFGLTIGSANVVPYQFFWE